MPQFERNGVEDVDDRQCPGRDRGHTTTRASGGEPIAEERFHVGAVAVTKPARREAEQEAIAVHLAPVALAKVAPSPVRGFSRDLATFTSVARRSVSAASARWPARVRR